MPTQAKLNEPNPKLPICLLVPRYLPHISVLTKCYFIFLLPKILFIYYDIWIHFRRVLKQSVKKFLQICKRTMLNNNNFHQVLLSQFLLHTINITTTGMIYYRQTPESGQNNFSWHVHLRDRQ